MNLFEQFESVAQKYVRGAPVVFSTARGSELFDADGNRYIDFQSGGGCLGFAHNDGSVRDALIEYLLEDGIINTGDRASIAKRRFIETFVTKILQPRNMNYKIVFTDPASGAAAEIALRLARRHKERINVVAFTNATHGLTEGSLSITCRKPSRYEFAGFRNNTIFMPFCCYFKEGLDTLDYFRRYLEDPASGIGLPAAVIVETVQVHGGVHVASPLWLRELEALCREFEILLIVDETVTGCGRVGPYFSFERAGITPDIVLMPNAVGGGLPLSMILLRPEIDHWRPGEQAGVLQGHNLAFVAASQLVSQWSDERPAQTEANGTLLAGELRKIVERFPERHVQLRGAGMVWGIDFGRSGSAAVVAAWALERGLIIEPASMRDEVLLVLPPLSIAEPVLRDGLQRLEQAVSMFLRH